MGRRIFQAGKAGCGSIKISVGNNSDLLGIAEGKRKVLVRIAVIYGKIIIKNTSLFKKVLKIVWIIYIGYRLSIHYQAVGNGRRSSNFRSP